MKLKGINQQTAKKEEFIAFDSWLAIPVDFSFNALLSQGPKGLPPAFLDEYHSFP